MLNASHMSGYRAHQLQGISYLVKFRTLPGNRTICQQTNLWSVKLRTDQLAD